MQRPHTSFFRFFLSLAFFSILVACSSSDSGSSGVQVTDSISGEAFAPSPSLAQFQGGVWSRVVGFFVQPAVAAITGLQPIQESEVQLVRLNNAGDVVETIDTTQTSTTGQYSFSLNEAVELTGDLAVRIAGAATELRSQVTASSNVRIDPISELVLRKLIEAQAELNNLRASDVVTLRGKVDEVDIDLRAVADLEQAISELDEVVGDVLTADAKTLAESTGNVQNVAGVWKRMMIGRQLGKEKLAIESEISSFDVVGSGSSKSNVTIGVAKSNFAYSSGDGVLIVDEPVIDQASDVVEDVPVTASNTLILQSALEEIVPKDLDPQNNYTVFPANTTRIQTAGNVGVSLRAETVLQYEAIDSSNDGLADTRGNLAQIDQGIIMNLLMREASDVTNSSMQGDWGVVRHFIELEPSSGKAEVNSWNAKIQSAAGGIELTSAANPGFYYSEMPLFQGATSLNELNDSPDAITFGVDSPEGRIGLGDYLSGYVAKDQNIFALTSLREETSSLASKETLIGVRKGATAPDLTGKSFRYFAYMTGVNGSETNLTAHKNGVISFDGTDVTVTDVEQRHVVRVTNSTEPSVESNVIESLLSGSYTVDSSKRIVVNGAVDQQVSTRSYDLYGFVAVDESLLVMAITYEDSAAGAGTGIVIGLPSGE